MEKNCPVCGKGRLLSVDNILSEIGGYIFVEHGERCSSCGEEFIAERDSQKTITAARQLGVWPEPMKLYRTLSKSGGTLVLRIPADLERQMKLREGEEVVITKVGNRVVLEPKE